MKERNKWMLYTAFFILGIYLVISLDKVVNMIGEGILFVFDLADVRNPQDAVSAASTTRPDFKSPWNFSRNSSNITAQPPKPDVTYESSSMDSSTTTITHLTTASSTTAANIITTTSTLYIIANYDDMPYNAFSYRMKVPMKYRQCNKTSDCTLINETCCTCQTYGGRVAAIAKKSVDLYMKDYLHNCGEPYQCVEASSSTGCFRTVGCNGQYCEMVNRY